MTTTIHRQRDSRQFGSHLGNPGLIADDSKTMTAIVFRILKDVNYSDIDLVYDGATALKKPT